MQVEKNLCLLTPRAEGRNLLLAVRAVVKQVVWYYV